MTPIDLIFDPAHDPINKPARKALSATQVRMHTLTRATIRNFRSCESVTLDLAPYTPSVGYNSADKEHDRNPVEACQVPLARVCYLVERFLSRQHQRTARWGWYKIIN